MSDSKDKPGDKSDTQQSGRVAFDARGNPIWEWQTSTGKFDRNVSTQRLKKLEAKDLTLMDTASVVPRPKKLTLDEPAHMPGGGVNPYDSLLPGQARNDKSDVKRRSLLTKLAKIQPRQEPEGPWAKLKKRFLDK